MSVSSLSRAGSGFRTVIARPAGVEKHPVWVVPEQIREEEMESYCNLVMRCPRLGGEVPFSYCEREGGELPCRQVVRCWEAGFPVEDYLRETLTPEAWERFCGQIPKDRVTTLLDHVEAAKRRLQPKE